jgi:transposase
VVYRALARPAKKAHEEGRTIVWRDASGCYLLPHAVRTWAPRGQTPVLHVPLTPDHLAAISGSTLDGRLYMQTRQDAFDAHGVVGFLRVLLRKLRGKVLVIWDGSPIHQGQPVKDFLARGAAKRVHLERLPGYAPDLNPDEGIWNYLKRVELKNRCCRDLAELHLELRRAKERLRHKRDVIRACSLQCGYSI